jgi:hypothetical protein
VVRKSADKSLAFLISYFLICSTTKIIFLEWVRTTKSYVCGGQGGICKVNTFFFNPVACFLYKAKDLSAPSYTIWNQMAILKFNASNLITNTNFTCYHRHRHDIFFHYAFDLHIRGMY